MKTLVLFLACICLLTTSGFAAPCGSTSIDNGDLTGTVFENAPSGTNVTTLLFEDDGSIRYELSGDLAIYFEMDGAVMKVKNSTLLDRTQVGLNGGTSYKFITGVITCIPSPGSALSYDGQVAMSYVNKEDPVIEGPDKLQQSEYVGIDSPVFTVKGNSGDNVGETLTYSIIEQNPKDFFDISASSGTVTLKLDLDYNKYHQHNLTIELKDTGFNSNGGNEERSTTKEITVDIIDYDNLPPVFDSCGGATPPFYTANVTTNETSSNLLIEPCQIQANDGDTGLDDPVEYSLISGSNNFGEYFEIASDTGQINVKKAVAQPTTFVIAVQAAQTERRADRFAISYLQIEAYTKDDYKPQFDKTSFNGGVLNDGNDILFVTDLDSGELLQVKASDADNPDSTIVYTIDPPTTPFQISSDGYIFARNLNTVRATTESWLLKVKAINTDADATSPNRESDEVTVDIELTEVTTQPTTMQTTQPTTEVSTFPDTTTQEITEQTTFPETTTVEQTTQPETTTVEQTTQPETTTVVESTAVSTPVPTTELDITTIAETTVVSTPEQTTDSEITTLLTTIATSVESTTQKSSTNPPTGTDPATTTTETTSPTTSTPDASTHSATTRISVSSTAGTTSKTSVQSSTKDDFEETPTTSPVTIDVDMVPASWLYGVAGGLSAALLIAILIIAYLMWERIKKKKGEKEPLVNPYPKEDDDDNESRTGSSIYQNGAYTEEDEVNAKATDEGYQTAAVSGDMNYEEVTNLDGSSEQDSIDPESNEESHTDDYAAAQFDEKDGETLTSFNDDFDLELQTQPDGFKNELALASMAMAAASSARESEQVHESIPYTGPRSFLIPHELVKEEKTIKEDLTTSVKIVTLKGYGDDGEDVKAVQKSIDLNMATGDECNKIKKKIAILKQLSDIDRPNILKYYGSYEKDDMLHYVSAFAENGSLHDKLRNGQLNANTLMHIISGIGKGLQYLHAKSITHGKLWSKAIMLSSDNTPMLTDIVGADGASEVGEIIRWQAIEVLDQSSLCTQASDVWSYGTLMWEIVSQGEIPYSDVTDLRNLPDTVNERQLSQPSQCSQSLFSIMKTCWNKDPKLRPDMYVINGNLSEKLVENSNDHIGLELSRRGTVLDDNSISNAEDEFDEDYTAF